MIAIIDYKAGNIASLCAALDRLGLQYPDITYVVTNDPAVIRSADRVIFPGQGRSGPAMRELQRLGLDIVIKELTQPFLGICLGMQLLADFTEEDSTPGLGIIPVQVKRFSGNTIGKNGQGEMLAVPHMGWNQLSGTGDYAYFVHSYYMEPNPEYTLATVTYGEEAAAIVRKDNFVGMQFHPEKSGAAGMKLLENFCTGGSVLAAEFDPVELDRVKFDSVEFELWPAIDLINGSCVRLTQGDYNQVTTYASDPIELAKQFEEQGASGIHIVDLDAAKVGEPVNQAVITRIVQAVNIPVEIGGGIRTMNIAETYLNAGIKRVIIGTAAIEQPEFVTQLIQRFDPDSVVVSLDVKAGKIAVRGWLESSDLSLETVLTDMIERGVRNIIITDIEKDGTLSGISTDLVQRLARQFSELGVAIYMAGGVTSSADVEAAKLVGARGVIIGKALYEGKIDLGLLGNGHGRSVQIKRMYSGLTKRIIPCMDIAEGPSSAKASKGKRVVKGTHFTELKDAGDPVELAKLYSEQGADELVFLDIMATVENRGTLYKLVQAVASNVTIPFTVGGGVKTIDDIRQLLAAGADKISIGSAAVSDPEFVREAANQFGAQCIVISVDAKRAHSITNPDERGGYQTGNPRVQPGGLPVWNIFIKGGREDTGIDALTFVKNMQQLGAGELLVNSLDRDGTKQGYDLELLKAIKAVVTLPVIASSGVGTSEHFLEAFRDANADAALAASVFHYKELTIPQIKNYLHTNGVNIRLS